MLEVLLALSLNLDTLFRILREATAFQEMAQGIVVVLEKKKWVGFAVE